MNKKSIVFYILFPILFIFLSIAVLFYLDLANGPIIHLVFMIILLVLYLFLRILTKNKRIRTRLIVILSFVVLTVLNLSLAKPGNEYKSAVDNKNPARTEILSINDGKIQGVINEDNSVCVYAGIPYAKAPVKDLRWKEPQDNEKWDGILDCSHFKACSMQPSPNSITSGLVDIYAQKKWVPNYEEEKNEYISEDSLYLNIWKPNNNLKNLPVLVYIHGGSLTTGSASFYSYNGEEFAKKNIIQVNIQYRLGIFGYLALDELANESSNHTTGNYGLLDQIKALNWVKNNIEAFGGDVNNITICGESAGSSSVSAFCASPLSKGLFQKAIAESSSVVTKVPPHTFRSLSKAKEVGNSILKEFNCKNVKELRNIKARDLVNTKFKNDSMTIDGYALPESPYELYKKGLASDVTILNGYNSNEADPFTIPNYLFKGQPNKSNSRERLIETLKNEQIVDELMKTQDFSTDEASFISFNKIISAFWFYFPHYEWNKIISENYSSKTYCYYFDKQNGYYSGYHSGELVYAFNNLDRLKSKKFAYNESDYKLANNMNELWASFIKTGTPQTNDITWTNWDKDKCNVLHLGENVEMIKDYCSEMYPIFEKYYSQM